MGAVGGVAILGGNFEAPTFPEDKVVQRSLTAGTQENSAIDAIILDALPLGAPGQLDSHAFLWKGHSHNGSPHTIDWKAFVNVTADDGTGSLWTLQTRIDGAPYTDILTVDDNGLLTVSGATLTMDQLIIDTDNTEAVLIRKDGDLGDVFIVDTINEQIMMSAASSLCWSTDVRLWREGPGILALRDGTNDQFFYIYATFTDSSNYERLALYAGGQARFFIEGQTAGTGQDTTEIDIITNGNGNIRLKPNGSSGVTMTLNPSSFFGTDANFNIGLSTGAARMLDGYFARTLYAGLTQTSPIDAFVLDSTNLAAPGTRDSNSILWTAQGFNSGQHDADWRAFVEATNNDGTGSLWKLATRIDAAGYADKLEIDDDGSFHIIQAGPHSFGGPLSGFTRFKISGSFISDGTGSQMEGFSVQGPIQGALGDNIGLFGQEINVQITTQTDGTAQNMGDIAALNVLEPQITDNMTGNITRAATVRILSMPTEGVENTGLFLELATQKIDVNNTEAFLVRKFPDAGDVFNVDTVNEQIMMSAASSLCWSTDVRLWREDPGVLALRDGTNDQFFYIYGTFTDSSNYERLAVYAGSSLFYIVEPQSAGTGNNTINMIIRGLGGGTLTLGQADNGGVLFLRGPARFETGAFGAAALGPLSTQQLVATPSGQTATATNRIPAGSLVLGITVRVVTTVTGPATFSIGDGVDVDRWGAGIAVAAGTNTNITDFTSTTIQYNLATAADVVITSDGVDFTGGEVRIIVYYIQLNPPLS